MMSSNILQNRQDIKKTKDEGGTNGNASEQYGVGEVRQVQEPDQKLVVELLA